MNKELLDKHIRFYVHNCDFLPNIETIKEYSVPNKDEEYYTDALKKIKHFIKEEIQKEYKKGKDRFIRKVIDYRTKDLEIDSVTKTKVFQLVFRAIDDKSMDYNYFKKLIGNNRNLKEYLYDIFYEEDKDRTVLNELKSKYKGLEPLFDAYRDNYFKLDPNRSVLTFEETARLIERIRNGDKEAQAELIEKNMGLVRSIAHAYQRNDAPLVNYEDLVQDGILGMMRAIELYDVSKKTRFSTYAIIRIKQSIQRSVANNGRAIRIPIHKLDSMRKIKKAINSAEVEEGYIPDEQMPEKIGISKEEYEEYKLLSINPDSIDRHIQENNKDGSTTSVLDRLSAETNVERSVVGRLDDGYLINLLGRFLNPREYVYILERIGVELREDGTVLYKDEKSRPEIAKQMHVSKERARQIEMGAFRKIIGVLNLMKKYDIVNGNNIEEFDNEEEKIKRRGLYYKRGNNIPHK